MNSQVSLCLPAILSNRESCKEGGTGQSKNNINDPHMKIPVLVSNSTQNEYKESSPSTKFKKFTTKPPGGISSVGSDRKVSLRCLAGFQQQLAAKGILRRATQRVTVAKRKKTQSNLIHFDVL